MKCHVRVPLGKVCTVVGGGTPRRNNPAYFGGNIPWATPSDVTALDGLFIERTKENLTDIGLRESSARLIPAGTVLMTSRATIGYTAIAAVPMATNQGFANLTCSEAVEPEYLAFWLRYRKDELIQLAGGTTFKEIPKSTLKKILIPLPPLEEQRRIVGILNRVAHIEKLRARGTDRLQQFIPSLFLKMFGDPAVNLLGWRMATLGDICISVQYGTSKKANDYTEGVPILRMGNVTYRGNLDCADLKYVKLNDQDFRKYSLRIGDILFNRTNSRDLVGKTGLWDGRFEAVAASYFIRVRVDENVVLPSYVWAFLNTYTMKRQLFAMARGAIGQANINAKEIKSLLLPLPPLEKQHEFAALVSRAYRTMDKAQTAAGTAAALSASLMDRLLRR